jgi:hypothetical protein
MPRYLVDERLPTIECCEVQYDWEEREDHEECLICGEPFDWDECADHWNDEDLYEVPEKDDDSDEVDLSKYFRKRIHDESEEYYSDLFKTSGGSLFPPRTVEAKGVPPTLSAGPRKKVEPEVDPFLDVDPPDEVL